MIGRKDQRCCLLKGGQDIIERVHGPEDSEAATIQSNIGVVHDELGAHGEALLMYNGHRPVPHQLGHISYGHVRWPRRKHIRC